MTGLRITRATTDPQRAACNALLVRNLNVNEAVGSLADEEEALKLGVERSVLVAGHVGSKLIGAVLVAAFAPYIGNVQFLGHERAVKWSTKWRLLSHMAVVPSERSKGIGSWSG